jgi:nucleoside-diphosphate-sugar epimerase
MFSVDKKKYLITGGAGFLGSALVKALVARGEHVRVLDNSFRGSVKKLGKFIDDIEFIEADIRDRDAVFRATEGIDTVCHLAFINGTELFYKIPEKVLDVGIKGAINTLEASYEHGVSNYILASSSEVYQSAKTIPTDETEMLSIPDSRNPRYSYAGGKLISEIMAFNYGRDKFDRTVVFRPHNVYGPDMGNEHVIPQFIRRMGRIILQQPEGTIEFEIQGEGTETRAFNYIDDFIQGLLLVMDRGLDQNIYHIGCEEEISISDLATCIAENMNRKIRIAPSALLSGSTKRRCPNISKLKNLGYSPKYNLHEGLIRTIPWYLNSLNQSE